MVAPDYKHVVQENQCLAKVVIACLFLVLGAPVAVIMVRAVLLVDNPPLESSLLDCGAPGKPAGCFQLPYFVFHAQPSRFFINRIGGEVQNHGVCLTSYGRMPGFEGTDGEDPIPKYHILPDRTWAVLNVKHMQPRFEEGRDVHLPVTFKLDLLNHYGSMMTVGTIDPAHLPQSWDDPFALQKVWKWQADIEVNLISESTNAQHINVRKSVVPDHTRFWGWLFDKSTHTTNHWQLDASYLMHYLRWNLDEQFDDQPKCFSLRMQFMHPQVAVMQPVSVRAQMFHSLASIGGLVTLSALIFNKLFVHKYPPSQQEKLSALLTLRGTRCHDKTSPARRAVPERMRDNVSQRVTLETL